VARNRSTTKAMLTASQINVAEMAKWSTAGPHCECLDNSKWVALVPSCQGHKLLGE